MTGTTSSSSSSPCGACKFLRRKCVRGCVFAPHFCYEQGSSHFAAIHKVFGASNASKILSHLPPPDRIEAAVTISYEAQARLQDPVYGCVSHIFALQQQVVNLQAQLASLKEQLVNNDISNNVESQLYPHHQDVQSWLHDNQRTKMPLFDGSEFNLDNCIGPNRGIPEDNASFGSMESLEMQYSNEHESGGKWQFQDDRDDLRSLAFGYNYNTQQLS